MSSKKAKVAVLVDTDGISSKHAEFINETAKSYGEPILRLACGTQKHLKGWRKHRQKYDFVEKEAPDGQNSTDKLIMSECVDIATFKSEINVFVLVANDKHFVKLCQMLLALNKQVIVIGKKAAESLKQVAEFVEIPVTKTPSKPASNKKNPQVQKSKSIKSLDSFKEMLKKAFAIIGKGWVDLAKLGHTLKQVDSSFRAKDYGDGLKKALEKLQDFVEWNTDKVKLKA